MIEKQGTINIFEGIKQVDKQGAEFWSARELGKILDYSKWENFFKVIVKAKEACNGSGNEVAYHFPDVRNMIEIGKGGVREIEDVKLSRYACYLIMQNADPRKKIVALGQTYFAIQTRRQEKSDQLMQLDEDDKRLAIRNELKEHNKKLVEAAKNAGVETSLEYATFQDHGYSGLYGGLKAKDIHAKKELEKSQKILDHMGSTELAANLFRATQTEEKLRRDEVRGKQKANQTHHEVGAKVRKTIEDLGGTMPEDLPVPEKSVKKIEKEKMKKLESVEKKR